MYGPGGKKFSVSLASGASETTFVNLLSSWDRVYIELPSFASGGTQYVKGGSISDDTFRRLHTLDPATGANNEIALPQSVSNCIVPLPSGFQFYKIETTTGIANGAEYIFHVS